MSPMIWESPRKRYVIRILSAWCFLLSIVCFSRSLVPFKLYSSSKRWKSWLNVLIIPITVYLLLFSSWVGRNIFSRFVHRFGCRCAYQGYKHGSHLRSSGRSWFCLVIQSVSTSRVHAIKTYSNDIQGQLLWRYHATDTIWWFQNVRPRTRTVSLSRFQVWIVF